MTPINFKASFLKTVYIPQKVSDLNYKNQEVSIVELDPKNQKDVMALAETVCKWESIAPGFSSEIYNEALKPKMYPDIVAEHYLALTTQNKDYKNLDANKVLGLALFSETMDSENQLNWLQVNPTTNKKNSTERKFKNIGTELVNYMKQITDKPIYVQSADDAVPFYKKNGFLRCGKHDSNMIWLG